MSDNTSVAISVDNQTTNHKQNMNTLILNLSTRHIACQRHYFPTMHFDFQSGSLLHRDSPGGATTDIINHLWEPRTVWTVEPIITSHHITWRQWKQASKASVSEK